MNSRFYAQARREDAVLREYLLRRTTTPATTAAPASLVISTGLPLWFERLLGEDAHVQALWQNEGKPAGLDQTPSGYDYSLLRYLVGRGVTNPDELGTIISRRPEGSVVRHQKGLEYVSRTVANALARGGARGGDA